MRSTTLKFLGIFAIVTAGLFSSCDDCKDLVCNDGTCVDGLCVCETGYTGLNCEARITAPYAGTFSGAESCTSGPYTWQTTITESTSEVMEITFSNLYGVGVACRAVVDADGTTFTIPSQTFGVGGTISGSGSINTSGSTITATYVVTLGTGTDNCTATLTAI